MAYNLIALFRLIDTQMLTEPQISLTELAKRTGVGRHTLSKAVRKMTGATFREFRNQRLLEETKSLLTMRPQQTLKQIAFQMGYGSQRALTRFVITHLGMPGHKWRVRQSKTSKGARRTQQFLK